MAHDETVTIKYSDIVGMDDKTITYQINGRRRILDKSAHVLDITKRVIYMSPQLAREKGLKCQEVENGKAPLD